jgi:hypothetical protein
MVHAQIRGITTIDDTQSLGEIRRGGGNYWMRSY